MLVTKRNRLERMLLHSRATSMFNPGMERILPCCETGTPTDKNRNRAAKAEPCCRDCTILINANAGRGTIQKRKARGKSNERLTRVPKQKTKAAIHHSTSAS